MNSRLRPFLQAAPICAVALAVTFADAPLRAQCPAPGVPGAGAPPVGRPSGPVTGGPVIRVPARPGAPVTGGPVGAPSGGSPATAPVRTGLPRPAAVAPTVPAVARPTTGSGVPRGGVAAGETGATVATADLSAWDFWWEYNQDALLARRAAVAMPITQTGSDEFYLGDTRRDGAVSALRPTPSVVIADALPALRDAAAADGPRDVVVAGLLALGRVGLDHPEFTLLDTFRAKLKDDDQTVRETAALAIGLAGPRGGRSLELLKALLEDDDAGRAAVGEDEVDERTRAFAAYGLGMLARRADEDAPKSAAADALLAVLDDRDEDSSDVRVAAIQALGVLGVDAGTYGGARLQRRVLDALDAKLCLTKGKDALDPDERAHLPTTMTRLLAGERRGTLAARCKQRFAAVLEGKELDGPRPRRARYPFALSQSCALALGRLGRADAEDDGDCRAALLRAMREHKDPQTRGFAAISLGQIGGDGAREQLLRSFRRASSEPERSWTALGLGMLARARRAAGDADDLVEERLLDAFARSKDPIEVGALAVALGMTGAPAAAAPLDERLLEESEEPWVAAALCDATALLGAPKSRQALYTVQARCEQPALYDKANRALARLGDDAVGERLVERLGRDGADAGMQAAIAAALADTGDRRQLVPLVTMLRDLDLADATRAGAARALGGIADPRDLRWNAALRSGANYRAAVATLTDSYAGVLDLR